MVPALIKIYFTNKMKTTINTIEIICHHLFDQIERDKSGEICGYYDARK